MRTRRRKRGRCSGIAAGGARGAAAGQIERGGDLTQALARLNEEEREAVALRFGAT